MIFFSENFKNSAEALFTGILLLYHRYSGKLQEVISVIIARWCFQSKTIFLKKDGKNLVLLLLKSKSE